MWAPNAVSFPTPCGPVVSQIEECAHTKGHQDITVTSADYAVLRIEPLYLAMPKFVHKKTNKFPVSCPGVEMVLRKWTDAKLSGQKPWSDEDVCIQLCVA